MRKVSKYLFGVGAFVGATLGGVSWSLYSGNKYTFSPSLKLLCYGAHFVNTTVDFEEAHGSLKEGTLSLRDVKIHRQGSKTKDFDLYIKKVEFVYGSSVLDLLLHLKEKSKSEIQIDSLLVEGVNGSLDLFSSSDTKLPQLCVKDLALQNIQLTITDRTQKIEHSPFTFPPIALYKFKGQHIRTSNIGKDIFLSSTLLGSFGSGLVTIERDNNNKIIAIAKNLPIGVVSKYLNEPFSWFTQATLDGEISDLVLDLNHIMSVSLLLRNLVPNPTTVTSASKLAIPMLTDYIKKYDSQIPIDFTLDLQEKDLTIANVSMQVSLQLVRKILQERREKIGKGFEDLLQYVTSRAL